jgi:hypothetical protein
MHPGFPVPNLTRILLKLTYHTGRDDLVHDFFVPCLETSVLYRRAAGYFTSAGLALAARGVASLALRRGRMRLVVSPHLEPDDCAALERAQENRAAILRTIAASCLATSRPRRRVARMAGKAPRAVRFRDKQSPRARHLALTRTVPSFRLDYYITYR